MLEFDEYKEKLFAELKRVYGNTNVKMSDVSISVYKNRGHEDGEYDGGWIDFDLASLFNEYSRRVLAAFRGSYKSILEVIE